MKKLFAIILCLTLCVATGASFAATYECFAALHTSADGIEAKTVEKFAELVAERTGGEIEVMVFAGGSLGTEQENLTQISTNEIQFCVFGDVFTAQVLQENNATAIP
ncbi:MAG: hypothetical protein Q4D04_15940, partial [Clostridia bacterium]|nr:hypothetical protein [Clostridia bacterium]